MIRFEDISVVIQGPVQASTTRAQEPGITQKCIESVRKHLPGATIIISTWEGQNYQGLEPDLLLLNQDPGGTITSFSREGKPGALNFNRQLLSTSAGLKQVKTPYAIKLRSDNFLTGNHFVDYQQQFTHRNPADSVFSERVIVCTSYFRRFADGQEVVMHPSDFFHFGRTEDLLKIWGITPFADLQYDTSKTGKLQYRGAPKTAPHAEQIYCNAWLRELNPNIPYLEHRHHATQAMIAWWQRFMASNLVILEPQQLGLGLIKRFIPKSKRPNEMSYLDWLLLYKQYCDPNTQASRLELFRTLGWRRLVKLPLSRLKFKSKAVKKFK